MDKTNLKPWKLLASKLVFDEKWFPVVRRSYQLPSGTIVDDFFVTTMADVSMVVPVTSDGKIIMVRQFKPGIGRLTIEFPAGRFDDVRSSKHETALRELEEETGIRAVALEDLGVVAGFVTKATEQVHCYLARNVEFNSSQQLDPNEDIEILLLSVDEIDRMILSNEIQAAISIAAWVLAKDKFSNTR